MPCTLNSECPGGACGRAGLETQPSACNDDTATPLDGSICQSDGNDEGHCPEGPFNPSCSVERFRGCTVDADCDCADCIHGQTCLSLPRKCFLDGGTIGEADHVTGAPDVPCDGVAYPTVGSFFCVAPVSANAVNSAAGLPGLGRVRIPGRVSIAP